MIFLSGMIYTTILAKMLKNIHIKTLPLISLLVSMLVLTSFSGDQNIWNEVKGAFDKGDAGKLSSYFASTLNLTVEDQSGSYSSRQAKLILLWFFSEHPPRSFSIKSNGNVSNNDEYMLGSYTSEKKLEFSVYVLSTKSKEGNRIIQLTIIRN